MGPKKHYIGWHEVENLVEQLYHNILESGIKFDSVYGLPRGGLTPAVMLSHKMGIPYDNFGKVLVVDDICDSGETLRPYISEPHQYTAVLHYKPHTSKTIPDFYAFHYSIDAWIVYPWENKDSIPLQDYKI